MLVQQANSLSMITKRTVVRPRPESLLPKGKRKSRVLRIRTLQASMRARRWPFYLSASTVFSVPFLHSVTDLFRTFLTMCPVFLPASSVARPVCRSVFSAASRSLGTVARWRDRCPSRPYRYPLARSFTPRAVSLPALSVTRPVSFTPSPTPLTPSFTPRLVSLATFSSGAAGVLLLLVPSDAASCANPTALNAETLASTIDCLFHDDLLSLVVGMFSSCLLFAYG